MGLLSDLIRFGFGVLFFRQNIKSMYMTRLNLV